MAFGNDDEAYRQLGAALMRAYRASRYASQREIVAALRGRVDAGYLSRALNGTQSLSLQPLKDLAALLGADWRQLLAEAGIDEADYRSRHVERIGGRMYRDRLPVDIDALLASELTEAERLKHEGQTLAALGAANAVERIAHHHLGGLPPLRSTQLLWAGFLSLRIGIRQDTRPGASVVHETRRDVQLLGSIGREFGSDEVVCVARFHAGDVLYKAGRLRQAKVNYAWTADHARSTRLRVRSMAGLAIALAKSDPRGNSREVRSLHARAADLMSRATARAARELDDLTGNVAAEPLRWSTPDHWTAAHTGHDVWTAEIFSRALLTISAMAEAAQELEHAWIGYEREESAGLGDACLAVALHRSRLRAALAGAIDLSHRELRELSSQAAGLAEAGSFSNLRAEIRQLTGSSQLSIAID